MGTAIGWDRGRGVGQLQPSIRCATRCGTPLLSPVIEGEPNIQGRRSARARWEKKRSPILIPGLDRWKETLSPEQIVGDILKSSTCLIYGSSFPMSRCPANLAELLLFTFHPLTTTYGTPE